MTEQAKVAFVDHYAIAAPKPTDKLWRYMSVTKFLDLILRSRLYFPSINSLRTADPYEGRNTDAHISYWRGLAELLKTNPQQAYSQFSSYFQESVYTLSFLQQYINAHADPSQIETAVGRSIFVNCWHNSDYESAALWSIYANPAGICVETTAHDLKLALADQPDDLYIGSVQYLDFGVEHFDRNNLFSYVLKKRLSFEHEHEVRLITTKFPKTDFSEIQPNGIYIATNISALIKNIHVSPNAQFFEFEAIKEFVNRLHPNIPVNQSNLNSIRA